jgi:hypothetical protein
MKHLAGVGSWRARFACLVSLLLLCPFGSAGANPPPSTEKAKSRLVELFLCKISDTLELSTDEEEKFRKSFHDLNEKKSRASQELDRLMTEMGKETDKKKLAKSLEAYNKNLISYNHVPVEEARVMRKLLGDKRFAQYLVLKRDLGQKLKNLLSSNSRSESNPPKE